MAAEALAAKTLATATAKATAGSTLVTANTALVASAMVVAQTQLTADLAAVISSRAAARAQKAWSMEPLSISAAQSALDAASVTRAALVTECGFVCDGAVPQICDSECGDGILASDEACDDQNTANNDGCSSTCAEEVGWDCTNSPCGHTSCTAICGGPILVPDRHKPILYYPRTLVVVCCFVPRTARRTYQPAMYCFVPLVGLVCQWWGSHGVSIPEVPLGFLHSSFYLG